MYETHSESPDPALDVTLDFMSMKVVFNNPFTVGLHSRKEWKESSEGAFIRVMRDSSVNTDYGQSGYGM